MNLSIDFHSELRHSMDNQLKINFADRTENFLNFFAISLFYYQKCNALQIQLNFCVLFYFIPLYPPWCVEFLFCSKFLYFLYDSMKN